MSGTVSTRIYASISLVFYILMAVFLGKVMKNNYCGLSNGWRVFAIILMILSIFGAIGSLVTLILG